MTKIDLDEHDRTARKASTQDEWQWRRGDLNVLEGKHDGQIVIHVHRSREEDLDKLLVASNRDRAHIAANSPPVTLALVARIRELEGLCGDVLGMLRSTGDYPLITGEIRALLEKGAVLP